MRLALASVVTLVVCGWLIYLWGPAGGVPVEPEENPSPVFDDLVIDLEGSGGLEELRAEAALEPELEPEPEEEWLRLNGEVIVAGVGVQILDGEIILLRSVDPFFVTEYVEVRNGRFDLEVPPSCDGVWVESLTLNGRRVILDDDEAFYWIEDWPIVVHGRWPETVLLSVLDATTGKHLDGVRVLYPYSYSGQSPGESESLVEGKSSPVEIDNVPEFDDGIVTLHVVSPGYAWKTIEVNLSQPGERELRLERAGELEVSVIGANPPEDAMFRLRDADGQLITEAPAVVGETIRALNVPAGEHRATIEVGPWYMSPAARAAIDVSIAVDTRSHYELDIPAPAESGAPLAGTLVVPSEWGFETFSLSVALEGDRSATHTRLRDRKMEALPFEKDAHAFDFGDMPPGSCHFLFTGGTYPFWTHYSMLVDLEPGGFANLRMEIPPPADVRVHLLDGDSDRPAPIGTISWRSSHAKEGSQLLKVEHLHSSEGYIGFRAPVGTIVVGSDDPGLVSIDAELLIQPGKNEFTFRLYPSCPLTIVFLDGDTQVPSPSSEVLEVKHLDGPGKMVGANRLNTGYECGLSEPGRYLVTMPKFRDFEPLPKQEIAVVRGAATRFEVRLTRKK